MEKSLSDNHLRVVLRKRPRLLFESRGPIFSFLGVCVFFPLPSFRANTKNLLFLLLSGIEESFAKTYVIPKRYCEKSLLLSLGWRFLLPAVVRMTKGVETASHLSFRVRPSGRRGIFEQMRAKRKIDFHFAKYRRKSAWLNLLLLLAWLSFRINMRNLRLSIG